MKDVCFSVGLVASLASLVAVAAEPWEDLSVNSINRLPARTYSMPLASEADALTDDLVPKTPYAISLNGNWKFSWAGNPDLRVKDFWKADFDDSNWFEIDVPSCVELRGFGVPGYTNVRYPHAWHPTKDLKNPTIRDRGTGAADYNPVSSYRRTFTVPADWQGRDIILRFDGVYSAYYVWVNGKKVGYAEDSKLPSEFNITKYLNSAASGGAGGTVAATNLLCVEVYRWCDGSFLEDQDMFRYSGIFRDVTLWSKPKDGVWDFRVEASADGRLEVAEEVLEKVERRGGGGQRMSASLYDADKKKIGNLIPLSTSTYSLHLDSPRLWSAEDPYLYTLVIRRGEDIRMRRIGFKEQKIVGNTFFVNGKPVKFKGVNRHETSPENGRTVSVADMLKDITLFKKYNINTVRTCHYPDHHLWYDLCDRYGIYVIAEANVEGHEPGYEKDGLGAHPEWDHAIVERNLRNAIFHRNNPSVTMWSMGNETGHGDCFRHAIAAVRAEDPSRPIHWERGNADADIDSTMYPSVEWLEKRGKLGDSTNGSLAGEGGGEGFAISGHTAGKCHIMCEYAHAMGNAIGNFQEYWDVVYAHPSLTGGCIWDWVDQAIWKYTGDADPKTGKPVRYLAYGGDFDEQPNDGPFCDNGVVDPLRHVSPKLLEVAHVYRNLIVRRSSAKSGDNPYAVVFELENRFLFTSANAFAAQWKLLEDGVVTKTGAFEPPALAPLSRCRFMVPGLAEALAAAKPGAEMFVNFEFTTKAPTLWAEEGWTVARDQVPLGGKNEKFERFEKSERFEKLEDERFVTIVAGPTKAVFSRKTGTLAALEMNGRTILRDAGDPVVAGPRLTCMRGLTDNDIWMRQGNSWCADLKRGSVYSCGLTQLSYHARPLVVKDGVVKSTVEVTGAKSAGFTHETTWTFSADGAVAVENVVTPHGTLPPALPRLGLSLKLDKALEEISWYGRGPHENYVDRKTGAFLGLWRSTVTEQFVDYVRPQDNGAKSDVRWVELTDKDGKGVRFSASEPMFVQALHHSWEDLEFARHRNGQQRFNTPLVKRPEVYLNLDVRQTGLGGASCGPEPMKKYLFPIERTAWTLRLDPVAETR